MRGLCSHIQLERLNQTEAGLVAVQRIRIALCPLQNQYFSSAATHTRLTRWVMIGVSMAPMACPVNLGSLPNRCRREPAQGAVQLLAAAKAPAAPAAIWAGSLNTLPHPARQA